MHLLEILQQANKYGEILTPAVISLITLAVALPLQAKTAQSKALKIVQEVYSGMLKDVTDKVIALEKTVKEWETKYDENHCAKSKTCKNREK